MEFISDNRDDFIHILRITANNKNVHNVNVTSPTFHVVHKKLNSTLR